ncbi:hypothetical protein [Micromonospora costi]|uniref:hypothetical protein n=1 Tax=Micromonospora costi TaxID=1530042 RepID=UPI0026D1DC2A
MALTTLDPRTALVLIDLQRGIVAAPTAPYPAAEVVARGVRLADAFRARGSRSSWSASRPPRTGRTRPRAAPTAARRAAAGRRGGTCSSTS